MQDSDHHKMMDPLDVVEEKNDHAPYPSTNKEFQLPLGDEALDMMYGMQNARIVLKLAANHLHFLVSLIIYGLADLRALARTNQISTDPAVVESVHRRILDLPITSDEIVTVCNRNMEKLREINPDKDLYFSAIENLFSKSIGSYLQEQVVVFDDANSDVEMVYAILTSEPKKRIVVAFRGSVTAMDWFQNSRNEMSEMPNPIQDGSQKSETLGVHLGFHGECKNVTTCATHVLCFYKISL